MRTLAQALDVRAFAAAVKRPAKRAALRRKVMVWLLIGMQICCGGCQTGKRLMDDPWAPVLPLDGSLLKTPPIEDAPPTPINSEAPRTLRNDAPAEVWDMRLDEALQYALAHSKVMVDGGGRVLQAPFAVQTVYDPAIRETDPLGGPIAALSAFDAQLSSLNVFRQANTFNNNVLLGGGTYFLDSTSFVSDTAITKKAATGGTFRLDTNTEYFSSDAPFNYFNSLTSTAVGGEIRQPLLRGAGVEYNRVAGAYQIPGAFNGIVLGRINTDISLLDFEVAVRTVLIDVERAYWDLALAYRDLDAKIAARDATLETWRLVLKKLQVGMVGADEEGEARAREQYYLLQAQVENAYSGAPPISAALGSTVGNAVIGNTAGVLGNERRLRLLLGLPPTDNRLIRPSTEPAHALVTFDWQASVMDALSRRVELRRQALSVKKRETELIATRNLRLPQLDAIAGASYRGYANDYSQIIDPAGPNRSQNFNNTNYNVGVNFSMPLGNRLARTAIRNAELQVARDRAILDEQRLHVVHELSSSMVELDRAFAVMNTNYNRRAAAQQQKAAITRKFDVGAVGLEPVLDSQRRWADAEASYHRAVLDYNRAIADVHLSRGTLLEYDGVRLADALNLQCDGSRFDLTGFNKEVAIDYTFSPQTLEKAPPTADVAPALAPIATPTPAPAVTPIESPLQALPKPDPLTSAPADPVITNLPMTDLPTITPLPTMQPNLSTLPPVDESAGPPAIADAAPPQPMREVSLPVVTPVPTRPVTAAPLLTLPPVTEQAPPPVVAVPQIVPQRRPIAPPAAPRVEADQFPTIAPLPPPTTQRFLFPPPPAD